MPIRPFVLVVLFLSVHHVLPMGAENIREAITEEIDKTPLHYAGSSSARGQGNKVVAELPIMLVDGYVLVKASINHSEELDFLFDTGCTDPVVDSAIASRLGLATRQVSRSSAGRSPLEHVVEDASLTLGVLRLEPRRLLSRSIQLLERRLGIRVDGVIGADLLRDYVIEVDYEELKLTLYDGDGYSYDHSGIAVTINANRFFSTVNAEISLGEGELVRGRFLIDTGAGLALALNTPFVTEHELVRRFGAPHIEGRLGAYGVEMLSHPGRIPGFRLGEHLFENMPVILSQTLDGPLSPAAIAGIIGNHVWMKFNTVFDYGRNTIYLEPNDFFESELEVDCSGLEVEQLDSYRIVN